MPFQALPNGRPIAWTTPTTGSRTVPTASRTSRTTGTSRTPNVSSVIDASRRIASRAREPELRGRGRGRATARRPGPRRHWGARPGGLVVGPWSFPGRPFESVTGRREQDALQRVELLQRLAGADGNSVQGVGRYDDRHAGLVVQAGVEAVEQRTAAGQADALVHDVGGQLGRRLVERDLDGVDDGRDRLLDRLTDLVGRGDDRLRQAGHEVAAADLGVDLLQQRPGRAEGDLDLLGRTVADGEAVLLLHEADDRVVELVARHPHRLARHDATEADNGHLGRAAADVDDHVPGRLLDRQAGADGRGHRLLDDVGRLSGAGVLGGLLHGPLLDPGDARR